MNLADITKKAGIIAFSSMLSVNLLFGAIDSDKKKDNQKTYSIIQENNQRIKEQQLKFKEKIWNLSQEKFDKPDYFDFRFKQSTLYKRLKIEKEGLGATDDDIDFSKEIMQTIWNNIKKARDKRFTKLEDRIKSFSDYTVEEFNNIILKTTHDTLVNEYGCTAKLGSNLSKGLKNKKKISLDCSGVSTFYYALNQIYDIKPISVFFAPISNVSVSVKLKNNPKHYFWEVTQGMPQTIYGYQYLFHMPRVVNESMEKKIYFTPLNKIQINSYLLHDVGVEWLVKKADPKREEEARGVKGTEWLLKEGNLKEAEKCFRKALLSHPNSTLANFHMGSYHFTLYNKFKKAGKKNIADMHNSIARNYYKRVIELDRYYWPAYKMTENLLNNKTKEEYEKSLAKKPNKLKYYKEKLDDMAILNKYYNDKAIPHIFKAERLKDEINKITKQPKEKINKLEVIQKYIQALHHYESARIYYNNRANYFRTILFDNKLHLGYDNNEPRLLEWSKKPDWAIRDIMKNLYNVECTYDKILSLKQIIEGKNKITEKFYDKMSDYYTKERLKWKKEWDKKNPGKMIRG
jgi:hypothetical protein